MALGEVINGNIRVRVLHRQFGKKRAKQISFFSGMALIFAICWFSLPWVGPRDLTDCFAIGSVWLAIMISLDLFFGRYVFKFKWSKIADDFNPLKGNFLSIGMVMLFLSPAIVFWIRF